MEGLCKNYKEGKKRLNGKKDHGVVKKYNELVKEKDSLFDMATSDPTRIKVCVEEWGVKRSEMEYVYLEDQRGERTIEGQTLSGREQP